MEPASPDARKFLPGFRISIADCIVLAVGMTGIVCTRDRLVAFIAGFVLGHFFLFCNVFRVSRHLELAWPALFVAMAGSTIAIERPGWPITIAASLIFTVVVVVTEMRKPSYHGVAWKWFNPALPRWWKAHHEKANEAAATT